MIHSKAIAFSLGGCVLLVASAAAQSGNLATLGTASQSSTDFGGAASRGNDGNPDGVYSNGSVTHTADLPDSSWEVDLTASFALDRVLLHNRSDCCSTRLSNFRVSVFNAGLEVFGTDYFVGGGSVGQGAIHTVPLPPGLNGDRVRVQILGLNNDGNGFLSLAEVEVIERLGTSYCLALPNSTGQAATLSATGSASVSANTLALEAGPIAPGSMGLFFYGPLQVAFPFGNGFRCVGAGSVGVFRLGPPLAADSAGLFSRIVDLANPPQSAGTISPGSAWNFQAWYADPNGLGSGFNLSDAQEIIFLN